MYGVLFDGEAIEFLNKNETIKITVIGHRKNVYKDLE